MKPCQPGISGCSSMVLQCVLVESLANLPWRLDVYVVAWVCAQECCQLGWSVHRDAVSLGGLKTPDTARMTLMSFYVLSWSHAAALLWGYG